MLQGYLMNRIYVTTILFKLINPTNTICNKGSAQNAECWTKDVSKLTLILRLCCDPTAAPPIVVETNSLSVTTSAVHGGGGVSNTPEVQKALQNRAKLNPIVKTVKNCWI